MRNFTISISENHYDDKNAIDWGKVKYNRIDDLSINNISTLIKEGHCFCGVYGNDTIFDTFTVTQKTEANWRCSYFVAFDLDNIKNNVSITDFLDGLPYKPTISYTTPNCSMIKPNETKAYTRIRLLYFFDKPIISKSEYQTLYDKIRATFNDTYFDIEKTEDKCGRSPYQQYSGNAKKDCKMIVNECVYNKEEILEYKPISKPIQDTEKPIQDTEKRHKIDDEFIQNLNTLKPTDFLSYYRDKYEVFFKKREYNDDGFCLITEKDVECDVRWKWVEINGTKKQVSCKRKDGQGRRHKLFCNAKIRCQLKPQISIEELIYNLVYERQYFNDNSDGQLKNHIIVQIALDAMKATYQMTLKKHKKFETNELYCIDNGISRNQLKNIIRRKLNFEKIKQWYDPTKSVKDNLKFAQNNNIKVGHRTLYNYCYEIGISTKGEKMKDTKIKAEISDILSDNKVDGTMHQPMQENAIQRKYKPISITEWVMADEYRKTCKLWQTFYAISKAI